MLMLRGRPWQQLRQTQPQKVILFELLWQISVMEEVIFRGDTIYQGVEARWGLVCLCRRRQLLGLPSLSQEAQDHRCDQLGGGEGTESVEQYLVTLAYSTCLFSLRA